MDLPPDFLERMDPYSRRIWEGESGGPLSAEQALRAREAYYACVDYVDDCIGDLLGPLEEEGLLDNTIVIYTSDHGEMCGERGMWGKVVPYEPSIVVPLLIAGPDTPAAASVAAPVSLMDLFPTTCGLAGLPVPAGLDGVDASDLLHDPAAPPPRRYAPSTYTAYGTRPNAGVSQPEDAPAAAMRALRGERWKYVAIEGSDPLMFDLSSDPGETDNLAADPDPAHAAVLAELEEAAMDRFSWDDVHRQLARDRERVEQFASGHKPSTPNQYQLGDGRVFDAEGALYEARWLHIPESRGGGIIPQRLG